MLTPEQQNYPNLPRHHDPLERLVTCSEYYHASHFAHISPESSRMSDVSYFLVDLYDLIDLFSPSISSGYLGPGGIHLYKDIASYPSPSHCIGGAAGYIDTQILTIHHIFKFPTALSTYEAGPFDPEGILGTLPSIFQVWLGVQTGMTLQVFPTAKARLIRWSLWAILTGGVGAALSSAKQTGGLIPLNKNLWSLSYVAVTTCFALLLLITLFVLIDLKKWWSGSPFYEPGMNSILLYVGHSVGYVILPFHFGYKAAMVGTHFVRLVEALWGTSLWVLIAIYLCNIEYFWTL